MEEKEIKLNKGWSLQRSANGNYMAWDKDMNVFIHGDVITLASDNPEHTDVRFYMSTLFVGSIWITTKASINRVKKLLELTNNEQ